MRYFACVVFGKTGVQIFGNSGVMVGFGGYIDPNIDIIEFLHISLLW